MIRSAWVRMSAAAVFLLICSAAPAQTASDETPAANPSRPTVTNPASFPPVGYVQFEAGVLIAAESSSLDRQVSLNQLTKLAITKRIEILAGIDPWAATSFGHGYSSDDGDVDIGVQGILLHSEKMRPTVAVSYTGRVHEGSAPDLDIGSFQQSAIVLVGGDVKKFHYSMNATFNEQSKSGVRRGQFGQTLAVSRTIGNWTYAGEIWHFTQPFLRGNAVGNLYEVSYSVRPNIVVDAGFDHGLTSTSTQWEGFTGITYLLPHRLWRKR